MKKNFRSEHLFFCTAVICLLTFQFARVVTSISIGLFLVSGIWALFESKDRIKTVFRDPLFIICILYYVLLGLDFFKGGNVSKWGEEMMIKSGLVILPLSILANKGIKPMYIRIISGAFVIAMTIGSSISAFQYLLNMDQVNELLLQSKHVPIIAKVHHIYFSLFLAVSCIIGFWLYQTENHVMQKRIWLVLLILQFIAIHLLSSRTALISFYAAIYLISLLNLFRLKATRQRIYLLFGMVLLPMFAVVVSPSIRHKIMNTKEDLETIGKGGDDINFKSFAMRMEAWKMSIEIIKANPIGGVGAGEVENEMQKMYDEQNSVLIRENRVGPHNQFLESTISHGPLGGILALLMFVIPLFYYRDNLHMVFVGIWAILGTTALVESVLERQLGVLLFGFFYVAALHFYQRQKMTGA